jgi:pimeloyl-ACP methyl ester carboxylesterase
VVTLEPPERVGTSALSDGRRLAWSEWGAPDGRPVLLCPGAGTSRWLGLDAVAVRDLGVRLVSVDRPGLGGSDPAPDRTLLSWADDVARLARARGLVRLRAVGFSQGAPFALACAAAGVVEAVAVVAGTDELAAPVVRDQLVPEVQRLVALTAADTGAAREAFRGAASAAALGHLVSAMSSDVDRAVYDSPAFAAAFRRALREAFVQGPDGYLTDTLLTMARWPFDPAAITAPVTLWYGRLDTSPVHSPDLGVTLHRRIPGSGHHLLDDEGAALLWARTGEVFDSLLS